ncbi:MAG: ABC transporter ATP-binding protein [Terrimesophilobacter sp.]
MLSIRDLSKTFDLGSGDHENVPALENVTLTVGEGEFVTVVGPSGCGKTTLLRSIAGFETPDTGSISLGGQTVFDSDGRVVPAHERGVGLVPQEGSLFPHLSVAQNVSFGLKNMSRRQRQARVDETLDLVSLGHLGKRRPHELSGGQQQRVALARAIAPNPRIILLDEPFSSLDEYLRESLRAEVRELLTNLGATVVLVTHDQAEALALGDRVVVMRSGRIVQVDDPRTTYYRPTDIELARFLGEAVIIPGDINPNGAKLPTVSCVFGTLPIAAWHGKSGTCEVLIRPENIQIQLATPAMRSGVKQKGLFGTVQDQTFYGHDGVIRVKVPELAEQVSVRIMGDRSFTVGDEVQLVVDRGVCTYAV